MGIQRCEEGETPINCVQSTMEPRHELAYEKTLVERVPARRLPGALDQRRCRWRATPPKTWSPTGAHRRPRMRLATCRVEEDGTHRLRLKKGITDMKHTQNLYHWWLLPLLSYLFKPHAHSSYGRKPWISFQPVSSSTNSPSSPADIYLTRWCRSFSICIRQRHTNTRWLLDYTRVYIHDYVLAFAIIYLDTVSQWDTNKQKAGPAPGEIVFDHAHQDDREEHGE